MSGLVGSLEIKIDTDCERAGVGYSGYQLAHPRPVGWRHRRQAGLFKALRIDHDECHGFVRLVEPWREIMDEPILGPVFGPFRQVVVAAEIVNDKRLYGDKHHNRRNRPQRGFPAPPHSALLTYKPESASDSFGSAVGA